jgi:hypothetical protein
MVVEVAQAAVVVAVAGKLVLAVVGEAEVVKAVVMGTSGLRGNNNNCHWCDKPGHWARECHSKPKHEEKTFVAKEEEELLLFAQVSIKEVHSVEEKLYVVLGDEQENEPCWWVLDTRNSNHMSVSRTVFSSIDSRTVGTVKLADGSVETIEGVAL